MESRKRALFDSPLKAWPLAPTTLTKNSTCPEASRAFTVGSDAGVPAASGSAVPHVRSPLFGVGALRHAMTKLRLVGGDVDEENAQFC